MTTSDAKATGFSSNKEDLPLHFSEWLKRRRQELDLTQTQLAQRANCSVFAIRKIEIGERQPSRQLARVLAGALEIPCQDQDVFIKAARGELSMERLGSLVLMPSLDFQPTVHSSALSSNLPRTLTPFIGREPELSALSGLLCDPQCSLLTIVGQGGIGKTRLAIEAANQHKDRFPDGVWFVPLAALNSSALLVQAIADAAKFRIQDPADPQAQLLRYLCEKRSLLILDNAEHLLDGVGVFTEILQACPQIKLLVTSRERLNLFSECVFDIVGLPVPANDQVAQFKSYSSVALFLQSARRAFPGFVPDERDQAAIVDICRLVEGMPLAIELAATWIRTLSTAEIASEIKHSLDFLSTSARDVPERHRSIKAVFDHSWEMLSAEEQQVLSQLSIFRGGFQRQAAEQVASASLTILMSLLSKSLLVRREDGRYDLHEIIRQCALEKLHDSGYFEETRRQHLAYFVFQALDAHQGLRNAQLAEWLRRIEQEHNNIRAALEWAFAPTAPSERVEEGLSLASSIDRYWEARGHIHEGIAWLERGLRVSPTVSLARARALRTAGMLYNHGDDEQTATRLLHESLAISRQLDDKTCQANALDTLGDVAWRFGDVPKAKTYYAESLELFRRIGDPRSIGLSLASAGWLHVDDDYLEAERLSLEGLTLLDTVSDLRGKGFCLQALGRVAILKGDVQLAALRFRQALRLNYELGYLVDIYELLHEIAVVEAILGDQSRAVLILAASNALGKKLGIQYPVDDLVDRQAPAGWLQSAPSSEEWANGEMMSMDQAVAYALEDETG